MTWTVETITNFLKENAAKLGHDFDIPVKINARFSSTLGAMRYIHNWDGTDTPTSIDISKQLIENASDKSIESTLLHELAHWVAIVEDPYSQAHGHDAVFKEICHRLGCDNDKTTANVEYLVNEAKIHKYSVYCPDCGFLRGYARKGKVLKNIHAYRCPKCGSGIYYEENHNA